MEDIVCLHNSPDYNFSHGCTYTSVSKAKKIHVPMNVSVCVTLVATTTNQWILLTVAQKQMLADVSHQGCLI